MFINEYGNRNDPTVILLAPMMISGSDLYVQMSPFFRGSYHIIAPDQGGHGKAGAYISADEEYKTLKNFLLETECTTIELVYGASMGVAVGYRLFFDSTFTVCHAWFDGVALKDNSNLAEQFMRRMFRSRKRKLAKTHVEASPTLVSMYGYDFARMMTKNFERITPADIDAMKKTELYQALCYTIAPCTLLTVLPIGWHMYISGRITADVFMTSIMLSMCIVGPILAAIQFTDSSAKVSTTVATVDELLAGEEQAHSEIPVSFATHNIEFCDVNYSYHKDEEVLHHVSLTIPEKSFTALVGPSGSGKSTIAKLVGGFWDVTDGSVRMDGKDLRSIPLEQLYDQVAYISQDNWLFDDTIMNNIRMGKTSASDEAVREAARASGCDEFIRALPEGYETRVGSGGTRLSGGERQRIAIARAMLKDAPIVILDEATAYIDPENEAVIQRALTRLMKDKTVIIIAHRLSTITDADQIVLINKGSVECSGTHSELLVKSDLYNAMWQAHISEGGAA